jgi:hypothetical protein
MKWPGQVWGRLSFYFYVAFNNLPNLADFVSIDGGLSYISTMQKQRVFNIILNCTLGNSWW